MARKFETTAITSTVKAPISKRSLTHINTAWDDLSEDIIKGLLGTYTTNDVIVLYGCVVTANIPGTSEVTAGAIFYNGRIYKVDANASISTPSNTLVWSIIETTISGDPATFSDGSSEDFHIIEKFRLTNAATGTGIADYNGATVKALTEQRNDDIQGYQTGWSNAGGCKFRELPFGDIEFTLHVAITAGGTTSVGTAPSWALPAILKRYYIGDYNGSDGASELLVLNIAATTGAITILKQSDGTKPANRADFYTTLRYNKFN